MNKILWNFEIHSDCPSKGRLDRINKKKEKRTSSIAVLYVAANYMLLTKECVNRNLKQMHKNIYCIFF